MLSEFPKEAIKLSYEQITHKKVYDHDWVVAIPKGKKQCLWFTMDYEQNVPVCLLLDPDHHDQPKPMKWGYDKSLVYGGVGTILYGTVFFHEKKRVMTVEDILYYKGKKQVHTMYKAKLQLLQQLFAYDLVQPPNESIRLALPIMKPKFQELLQQMALLQYPISHIQCRYLHKGTNVDPIVCVPYVKPSMQCMQYKNNAPSHAIFKVKAELQNDIYHLYVYHNGQRDHFYDVAFIPDYKTSVFMNQLFRTIKENANLDALEESDDEAEFESDRVDKFVNLEKELLMTCHFNWKFKKWVPVHVVRSHEKMVTLRELQETEKPVPFHPHKYKR